MIRVKISVVSPVYGCVNCLDELVKRIIQSTLGLYQLEIILVCDGDIDGSWAKVKTLANDFPEVRGLRLMRNSGQHNAVTAGLRVATGEYAVVLDCDLGDQPEDIPRLIESLGTEFDIALGYSEHRSETRFFGKLVRGIHFYFLKVFSNSEAAKLRLNFSFFAITKNLVDAYNSCYEKRRQVSTLLLALSDSYVITPTTHMTSGERNSTYDLLSRVKMALESYFLDSRYFLKRFSMISTVAFFISVLVSAGYIVMKMLIGTEFLPGWFSTMLLLSVIICLQLLSIAVSSTFINEALMEVRARPAYIIREDTQPLERITN
jgi:glycosyltransferase involved in cell wall biosynthesis